MKFTSFGIINGFVLATVSVGIQFQISLLGLARIQVPPQPPGGSEVQPIAGAELALKVCLSLSSGALAVEGQLTENSFILSRQCRLTGGFAFNCWFCPEHLGDFVVSLGGYHPRWVPPAHYPAVPRLGMQWSVSKHLSITGGLYFALTPSCCMAGGKLEAVFAVGGLRAWFYAYVDILIGWKPLYYDVAVAIGIGVSYTVHVLGIRKTFAIELSATLHIWGPPFAGIAHVNWWVISFDIEFGSQKKAPPGPIDWQEFHQSFLPQPDTAANSASPQDPVISKIRIANGLIGEVEMDEQIPPAEQPKNEDGHPIGETTRKVTKKIVNAHELSFATEASVPCTSLHINDKQIVAQNAPDASQLGIKPMGIDRLNSEHRLVIEKIGQPTDHWGDIFESEPTAQGMPQALWSSDLAPINKPGAERIKNVPNGMKISLRTRDPSHSLEPIDCEKFKYEIFDKSIDWADIAIPGPIRPSGDEPPGDGPLEKLMNTIWDNDKVEAERNAIVEVLNQEEMHLHKVEVPELAAHAAEIFQSPPTLACLGEVA